MIGLHSLTADVTQSLSTFTVNPVSSGLESKHPKNICMSKYYRWFFYGYQEYQTEYTNFVKGAHQHLPNEYFNCEVNSKIKSSDMGSKEGYQKDDIFTL